MSSDSRHSITPTKQDLFASLAVLILALGAYCFFAPAVVVSGDSAELTYALQSLQTIHPPGYPMYLLLGNLIISLLGGSDTPYVINGLSALYSALGLSVFFLFLRTRSRSFFSAILVVLCMGVSINFWEFSVKAEVYSLMFLLMVGLLLVWAHVLRTGRYVALLWFMVGLNLTHHPLNGIGLLLGIHGTIQSKRKFLFKHFIFLCIPLLTYFTLLIPGSGEPFNWPRIDTVSALFDHVLGGSFYRFFMTGGLPGVLSQVGSVIFSHFMTFPLLVFPVMLIGYFCLRKQDYVLVTIQGLTIGLMLFYSVPDVAGFLVPSYIVCAYVLSVAIDEFPENKTVIKLLLLLVFLGSYAFTGWYLDIRYQWSNYRFSEKYLVKNEQALDHEERSIVLSDWSHYTLLRYYQVREDRLRNLQLISPTHRYDRWPTLVEEFIEKDLPVYTTIKNWDPPPKFNVKKVGYLYRVELNDS